MTKTERTALLERLRELADTSLRSTEHWPQPTLSWEELDLLIALLAESPSAAPDGTVGLPAARMLYRSIGNVLTVLQRKREPSSDEQAQIRMLKDWERLACNIGWPQQPSSPSVLPAETWFLTKQPSSHDCYEHEYRIGARSAGIEERFIGKIYRREDAERIIAAVQPAALSPAPSATERERLIMLDALKSIAANSCCHPCREAGLVATYALNQCALLTPPAPGQEPSR